MILPRVGCQSGGRRDQFCPDGIGLLAQHRRSRCCPADSCCPGRKTFTRTLAVYVTTQQLHRLSVVQGMLKHIDFSTASPTVRQALQKGTGAGNISALNKVMKGSLVTSLALVAVTTGPDMIKMLRGRISGAQFIRNLAVASSCVAGGAVGSVAGGILFSPLGPFGALTGRVVGGVLGE